MDRHNKPQLVADMSPAPIADKLMSADGRNGGGVGPGASASGVQLRAGGPASRALGMVTCCGARGAHGGGGRVEDLGQGLGGATES